jgi:hypothetical protein
MAAKRNRKKEFAITTETGPYANGDVVGGRLNLSSAIGAGGEIRQIRLIDDSDTGTALFLYLFDGAPTSIADNAVFATTFAIADHKKLIARISIAAAEYLQINSNKTVIKDDVNLSVGTGELYGYLVTNGTTPTFGAATALTLEIVSWEDVS